MQQVICPMHNKPMVSKRQSNGCVVYECEDAECGFKLMKVQDYD